MESVQFLAVRNEWGCIERVISAGKQLAALWAHQVWMSDNSLGSASTRGTRVKYGNQ
jgi:hypothetical protein